MVTYQEVYAEMIAPAVMLVNYKTKSNFSLYEGFIQALGADTVVGGIRYYIDVILSSNVLLRIYYYNDPDAHISIVQQEQYLVNNANVTAMFILHSTYTPRTIAHNIDTLIALLVAAGAEYQYFAQNNYTLSLFSNVYVLVDHLNNRITDDQGNVITL